MKHYFILLFTLLQVLAFCQNKKTFGIVGFEFQSVDFTDFNRQSRELGFTGLPDYVSAFFGGVQYMNGKNKSTTALHFGFMGEEGGLNNSTARYEYIGASLLYAKNLLRPSPEWFFGPEFGIQIRGEQTVLGERGAINGLANAAQASFLKFARFAVPIQLGINGHYTIHYGTNLNRQMLISVRTGYRFDLDRDSWKIDQALTIENHGINTAGFYAGFSLSFGKT